MARSFSLVVLFALLLVQQSIAILYRIKVEVAPASEITEGKLYVTLPTNPPTEVQLHDHSTEMKPGESYVFNKDLPNIDDIANITIKYKRRNLLKESTMKINKVKVEKLEPGPNNRADVKITFCGHRPQVLENEQWHPLQTSRC